MRFAIIKLAGMGALPALIAGVVALSSHSANAAATRSPALSVHKASTTTYNKAGDLVATAHCGVGEHVVSGGFKAQAGNDLVSHAVGADAWTVAARPDGPSLTTYAYCARGVHIVSHEAKVKAQALYRNTSATAHCGSGQKLVSGGYQLTNLPNQQEGATLRDYASGDAWQVMSVSFVVPAKLKAFAYCERGMVVKVSSATSGPIARYSVGSVTVSCRQGETLLGGGFSQKPTPDFSNISGPDIFVGASHRSGPRSWTVSGENFSPVAGKLIAFAYCAS